MTGPIASVLLPIKLSPDQIDEMLTILQSISDRFVDTGFSLRDFGVVDTRPIGGNYVGMGEPFDVDIDPEDSMLILEPDEVIEIIKCDFGFMPQQALYFYAMCNGDEDHLILGELVLYFAEKYHGIINLNGTILPRHIHRRFGETDWNEIAALFDEWQKQMPGKICTATYQPIPDRTWASHTVDVEFFRAWLKHPDFRMIK